MPERLVVADTSPLLYLNHAEHLHLLTELYGSVTVPSAVQAELEAGREHGYVVPDISTIDWIRPREVPDRSLLPAVVDLGPGESEVIALGLAYPGSLALLDDRLARRIAALSGLTHTGTLGVLLKAKSEGHLPAVRSFWRTPKKRCRRRTSSSSVSSRVNPPARPHPIWTAVRRRPRFPSGTRHD